MNRAQRSLLLIVAFPTLALGAQMTTSGSVPVTEGAWADAVQLQAFDPALGDLLAVHFMVDGSFVGVVSHENKSATPGSYVDDVTWNLDVTMDRAELSDMLILFDDDVQVSGDLDAYDGSEDYAGASGVTHDLMTPITGGIVITGVGLQDFIGTGTVAIHLAATGAAQLSMSEPVGVSSASTGCGATVTAVYEYTTGSVANETATWSDVKALYR